MSQSKCWHFTADFTSFFSLHILELNKALRFQMDFTSMNFGDLLFALNCDPLKNKITKIEKINNLNLFFKLKMVFILMKYIFFISCICIRFI